MSEEPRSEFEEQAQEQAEISWLSEFWDFLRHNKKWWLLPLLIVLLLFGLLVLVSGTAYAPFIYTLY
jgi:hypothetical protein